MSSLHCKESCSPAKTSGHLDMVMEATNIDLGISRLRLKTKLEEINFEIKGLQSYVRCLKEDRAWIKTITSDEKFTSME